MKTQNTKKSILSVLMTTVAVTLFTQAVLAGEPRSGPDLAGTSIPLSGEQGMDGKKLRAAVSDCMLSGKNPSSLFLQIVKSLGMIPKDTFKQDKIYGSVNNFDPTTKTLRSLELLALDYPLSNNQTKASDLSIWYFVKKETYSMQNIQGWANEISVSLTLPGLPYFKFSSNVVNEYDELGQVTKSIEIISDIQLVIPENYSKFIHAKNVNTMASTSISVNAEVYLQCLQNAVQR